ncbi:aldehyde dehydrogenase family protein [Streptomyces sp. NBC_01314]|uniref:aldehyde dehydrogenase family protein n=1 Tax=Streptomyces sp. NBC_01314 TaxID=2903821 RepID=UPI00352ED1C3
MTVSAICRAAVASANDNEYGLRGSVWTDIERGTALARRIRTGTLGYSMNSPAPFGGCKASGLGRQNGLKGLMRYVRMSPSSHPWPDRS